MTRMNSRQRKKYYALLVKRDKEKCARCGATPPEKKLVIDHIDNDDDNNDLGNLQLLCRSCNYLKNPRKQPLDDVSECVNENMSKREDLAPRTELEINRAKEPRFRQFLGDSIKESPDRTVEEKEVVNSGAFVCEISPITAQRYLNKLCSSAGPYQRVRIDKTIAIRKR